MFNQSVRIKRKFSFIIFITFLLFPLTSLVLLVSYNVKYKQTKTLIY